MKLFKVRVTMVITKTVDIPVVGESEDDVRAYMASTEEWRDDGAFNHDIPLLIAENDSEIFSVKTIQQVAHPKDADFQGDVLCWGALSFAGDEITASAAFYNLLEPSGDDGKSDAAWNLYFAETEALAARYDTERLA